MNNHTPTTPSPLTADNFPNKHLRSSTESLNFNTDIWSVDFDEYNAITKKLGSKSAPARLEGLRQLLHLQIIDVKLNSWEALSEQLQNCLSSSSDEVFSLGLRAYYKVVCMPNVCSEGYLSLVKGLGHVVGQRVFVNQVKVDFGSKVQVRVLQILKIVLKTQKVFLRSCVHIKQQTLERVIDNFVKLLLTSKQCNGVVLDILCILDRKASWFSNFCCSIQFRGLFLKKIGPFVTYEAQIFMNKLDELLPSTSKQHLCYKLDFSRFSHSVHFLIEVLKYASAAVFFPLKLPLRNLTVQNFLTASISKINDATKSNEDVRLLLIDFVKGATASNVNYIGNELLNSFVELLNVKAVDKKRIFQYVQTNKYILEIINDFCLSTKNSNVFFGTNSTTKRPRNTDTTVAQTVIGLTIFCIRTFINRSEHEHQMQEIVVDLLHCCRNLYRSYPKSFTICNPRKLILATKDLHNTASNYNVNLHYKVDLADVLCFFVVNYCGTLSILSDAKEALRESVNCKLMNENLSTTSVQVLVNLSNFEESDCLKSYHDYVLKPFLEFVWYLQETDVGFLEEIDVQRLKLNGLHFLHVIFALSGSEKLVKGLLTFENDGTLVENDGKPLTLAELIEYALNEETGNSNDALIGLIVLKILLVNADLLVFLEHTFKLREQLNALQQTDCTESSPVVIDSVSSLRHNILLSLKHIGFVDSVLNDKILEQTHLLIGLSENSLWHEKSQNELQKFVAATKNGLHDNGWLLQARRCFRSACTEPYKACVVSDLIKYRQKNCSSSLVWPDSDVGQLFDEDQIAISSIVRFGVLAGYLHSSSQSDELLASLIRQSRALLNSHSHFDWFVAVVFLITGGNLEKAKNTLVCLTKINVCLIIWPTYGTQTDPETVTAFYDHLDVILRENLLVHASLNRIGVVPRNIVQRWLSQSFFNVLPFYEICNFISLSVLFPQEYVLYFFAAVFKHVEAEMCAATQEYSTENVLKMMHIPDFRTSNYLQFMDGLSKRGK